MGTVTFTGALATVRGRRLLAEWVVATAGTCRSMKPGPDATGATTRTVTKTAEEEGGPAEDGGRAAGLRPGPGAHGDGTMTDRGEGNDADGGEDGGPDRGGGRVASLVPGPGAGGRRGVGAQGTPEHESEQPVPPPNGPTAGGGPEAAEAGAQAEGGDTGTGAPLVDPGQQDQGSWGWGWWGSGTWQSGSSHGGWWDRHQGDGDDGDAWARWNRSGHGVQPGSHSGYGGGGRRRPKPSEVAAALGRSLTKEEWIEELIADPPAQPEPPGVSQPGLLGEVGAWRLPRLQEDRRSQIQGEDEARQLRQRSAVPTPTTAPGAAAPPPWIRALPSTSKRGTAAGRSAGAMAAARPPLVL